MNRQGSSLPRSARIMSEYAFPSFGSRLTGAGGAAFSSVCRRTEKQGALRLPLEVCAGQGCRDTLSICSSETRPAQPMVPRRPASHRRKRPIPCRSSYPGPFKRPNHAVPPQREDTTCHPIPPPPPASLPPAPWCDTVTHGPHPPSPSRQTLRRRVPCVPPDLDLETLLRSWRAHACIMEHRRMRARAVIPKLVPRSPADVTLLLGEGVASAGLFPGPCR